MIKGSKHMRGWKVEVEDEIPMSASQTRMFVENMNVKSGEADPLRG